MLASHVDRKVKLQRGSEIICQELGGMIAKIELIGEEAIHRRLIGLANVSFYFAPGIEGWNNLGAVIEQAAYRTRHPLVNRENVFSDIPLVAAEELVTAVASKHDLD